MSTILSKDRVSLCSFSFADGRRCRTPRSSAHPRLCAFHARKEAQALAARQVGRDLSSYFSGSYLSACDLSAAMGHLFSAVAQDQIEPKKAANLAYIGQTLLQSIHLAEHEYINAFGTESWRRAIRHSFAPARPSPASAPPKTEPAGTEPGPPTRALPLTAATYVESTLAKLHENKRL